MAMSTLEGLLKRTPDYLDALKELEKLMADDQYVIDVANILVPIYQRINAYDELVNVYQRKLAIVDDDFEKKQLCLDAATLCNANLGRNDEAFELLATALKLDPSDSTVVSKLNELVEQQGFYDKYAKLIAVILKSNSEPDVVLSLSAIAAKLYESHLDNNPAAIKACQRILEIDEFQPEALESLHRLYEAENNYKALADILQRRLDISAQPINGIRYQLGRIKMEHSKKFDEAFELFRQILWEEPENQDAIGALEELLERKDLREEIIQILEPYYEKHELFEKQYRLLLAKLEITKSAEERSDLQKFIANFAIEKLHKPELAFEAYARALAVDPQDEELLQTVEKLGNEQQLWEPLTEAFLAAGKSAKKVPLKLELHRKAAAVCLEHISDPQKAEGYLKSAVEVDVKNMDIYARLTDIYEALNMPKERIDILEKRANLSTDDAEKKELLSLCSNIALKTLDDRELAISYLEKVLVIDELDAQAIEKLLKLYVETEQPAKRVELLKRKLQITSGDDALADIHLLIAVIARDELKDDNMAMKAYRDAVELKPDKAAFEELEKLYRAHNCMKELSDMLKLQLESNLTIGQRCDILYKLAIIARDSFKDNNSAIDYMRKAMELNASRDDIFNDLDKALTSEKRFDEVRSLLEQRKEAANSVEEKISINIRIANLAGCYLGDRDGAIASLNEVLKLQSDNTEALNVLADIYEKGGEYDKAIEKLEKKISIVADKSEKAAIYCKIASLVEKQTKNDLDQVKVPFDKALAIDPRNSVAMDALMDIAKKQNDVAKEIQLLNVVASNEDDLAKRNSIYLKIVDTATNKLGDYAVVADALEKIIENSSEPDSALTEKLLNAYVKSDKLDKAQTLLQKILDELEASKQTKQMAPYLHVKGQIREKSGDSDGALEAYKKAYDINAAYLPNIFSLGLYFYNKADYNEALKYLQTLLLRQMDIKEKTLKLDMFYYLGMVRLKSNDPKRAKDMFKRALGVDPNHGPSKEEFAKL